MSTPSTFKIPEASLWEKRMLAKDGKVKVSVNGNEIDLGSEYLAREKRLMLDGKAVDTLQIDNVLVAIEM